MISAQAPGAKNNLDEMLQVLDTEAPALVDPEVLEICYEVAAEEEKELGLQQIASLLDAGSGPVDIYRTFRVLSCELGKVFFQHKLYVLDLLVVGGSLVLELTLRSNAAVAAIAEVIIFARLWRLVRIGHGLFTQGVETSE